MRSPTLAEPQMHCRAEGFPKAVPGVAGVAAIRY